MHVNASYLALASTQRERFAEQPLNGHKVLPLRFREPVKFRLPTLGCIGDDCRVIISNTRVFAQSNRLANGIDAGAHCAPLVRFRRAQSVAMTGDDADRRRQRPDIVFREGLRHHELWRTCHRVCFGNLFVG